MGLVGHDRVLTVRQRPLPFVVGLPLVGKRNLMHGVNLDPVVVMVGAASCK